MGHVISAAASNTDTGPPFLLSVRVADVQHCLSYQCSMKMSGTNTR